MEGWGSRPSQPGSEGVPGQRRRSPDSAGAIAGVCPEVEPRRGDLELLETGGTGQIQELRGVVLHVREL